MNGMQRVLAVLTAMVIGAALAAPAAAEDRWPRFRGPGALGVSEETGLPETWSDTENVAWVTEIAGLGWSSPIVWDDLVVVTSVVSSGQVEAPQGGLYLGGERGVPTDEHRWLVYGIDAATGAVRWEREVHRGVPAVSRHLKNTYASETPVTDGEHIYAYFGNVGLFCLDMEGRVAWSRPFEPVATRAGWGTASSPVLHGNRVYVVNDNEEQSYLLALSKETGAELWRVDRDEGTNWSTPYVWEHEQGTEIITTGTDRVRSYDLDGGLLWEIGGMSSIVAPTPFSRFGLLYVSSGYIGDQRRPVFAVRPGARGDLSVADDRPVHESLAWHLPQGGSYNTSPLVYGDYYYTLFDRGYFTCHDARTGEEVYGRQRIRVGAAFSASPWAYSGKIFALSEDGDTYVMKAGPQFELLGTNSLGEFTMATPAIAHGSLFIRTASKLYRITEGGGGAQ